MPQQLDRDPNALATLLRGQTQIPRYTEEEESLQSMIPEEQLYQMQDAQSDAGRARGGPYSVSSRDSLRESGVAGLRQMLGLQQAAGQAKAYPNQVAGEYGLQEARIKGNYDVESAKQKAIADAAGRTQTQEFQQGQQERNQTFQGGQGDLNRAAINRNTQAAIGGRENVANIGANSRADTQAAITDRKTGGENRYWGPDFLKLGPDYGTKAPVTGAPAPAASANVTSAVQTARRDPALASLSFQDLLAAGKLEGASSDEIAEFQLLWEGAQ